MWHRKAMDKETVMATKFSEIFAISMPKKHRKFLRRGLTHLDATPNFKNRPNTYGPPCTLLEAVYIKAFLCLVSKNFENLVYHKFEFIRLKQAEYKV
jgi:hypothetical protein